MATSGAYKNQAFTFNYALPKSSDPTAFFTGPFASGEVTYRLRNGSTLGAAVPVTPLPTFPTPSTGPFTVALTSSMMNADEVIIEFIASTSDFATRTVSIVTEPTASDILEVQQTAVSGVADFRASGFSTFNPATDTVANVTTVGSVSGSVGSVVASVTAGTVTDKTGYSISGTLTTLDALDTAQDSQHATTQSAIGALNDFDPSTEQVTVATNNDKTGYALSSAANDAIGAAFLSYTLTKGSPGTIERAFWQALKTQALTDGEVSGTPGVSAFDTNLTATTGAYNHLLLLFTSGALAGEARPIDTYVSTNGRITLQEALTAAPSAADEFIIVPDHTDPISDIQSGLATSAALAVVDSNVDSILADTSTDGVVISTAQAQAIADEILKRSVGNVEGATLSEHSLATIVLAILESQRVDSTWTIYRTNGTTVQATKTLTLDPAAEPVTRVQ